MKNNKKGFTLIELLAVIVILAVVMLIAATAVLPMMTKSRKNALLDEGYALEKAAKLAYQDPTNETTVGKTVCFSLEYLYKSGFYEKGSSDEYYGSVLIIPNGSSFNTYFWISNNTYGYKTGISSGTTKTTYDKAENAKSLSSTNLYAYTACGYTTKVTVSGATSNQATKSNNTITASYKTSTTTTTTSTASAEYYLVNNVDNK